MKRLFNRHVRLTNEPQHRVSATVRRLLTGASIPLGASIAVLLACGIPSAAGATNTFNGGATWNSGANWSSTVLPAATDDLQFNGGVTTALDAAFTVQTLNFNIGAGIFNLNANGTGTTAQTLTLNGPGNLIDLNNATTGAVNIGAASGVGNITLALGSSGTFNVGNAAANLNIGPNAVITGTGFGLTKSGAGTLTLSGSNLLTGSYTGTTSVTGGTLIIGPTVNQATTTFSSSSYTLSNTSTLRFDVSKITTTNNAAVRPGAITLPLGTTVELYSDATNHNSQTNSVIIGNNGTASQASFTGAGNLNKEGAGIIVINNPNVLDAFTGTLNVNGGILALQGPTTSTVGNFAVNVAGGTLDLRTDNMMVGTLTGSGNIIKSFTGSLTNLTLGNDNGTGTYSGNITTATANIALVKAGTGTQTLSGTNAYGGTTTVNAGTLLVNGTHSGSGAVSVTAGTLGGTGSFASAVTIGNNTGTADSFVTGGAVGAIGTLSTTGALSLGSDAVYKFDLNSTLGTADQLAANGVTLNAASTFSLTDINPGTLASGTFTVINNTATSAAISGTFANLADGSFLTSGANTFQVSYHGGTGNDLTLTVVPEPGAWMSLLGGCGVLLGLRRRRSA